MIREEWRVRVASRSEKISDSTVSQKYTSVSRGSAFCLSHHAVRPIQTHGL